MDTSGWKRGTCVKWLGRMIEHPRWNFLFNRFLPHSTSAIGYTFFSIENLKITNNWSASHLSFIFYDISNPNFRSMPCTPWFVTQSTCGFCQSITAAPIFSLCSSAFSWIQLYPTGHRKPFTTGEDALHVHSGWCMVSLERLTGLNQGNRENSDKNGLCTKDKNMPQTRSKPSPILSHDHGRKSRHKRAEVRSYMSLGGWILPSDILA